MSAAAITSGRGYYLEPLHVFLPAQRPQKLLLSGSARRIEDSLRHESEDLHRQPWLAA